MRTIGSVQDLFNDWYQARVKLIWEFGYPTRDLVDLHEEAMDAAERLGVRPPAPPEVYG